MLLLVDSASLLFQNSAVTFRRSSSYTRSIRVRIALNRCYRHSGSRGGQYAQLGFSVRIDVQEMTAGNSNSSDAVVSVASYLSLPNCEKLILGADFSDSHQ